MSRDLRKFNRGTTIRLIIGAFVLLFTVGLGLIFLIYGPNAAVSSLLCMVAGLFPVGMIVGILYLLDWIVKRADRD